MDSQPYHLGHLPSRWFEALPLRPSNRISISSNRDPINETLKVSCGPLVDVEVQLFLRYREEEHREVRIRMSKVNSKVF